MGDFDWTVTRERMERWARDPNATLFGMEQDEDLVLGVPENVPLMCEYLDRTDIPMTRRTVIVLAMAEMLMLERSESFVTPELADVLKKALIRNEDAVLASYDGVVGLQAQLMLCRLLGHTPPDGVPDWLLRERPAV